MYFFLQSSAKMPHYFLVILPTIVLKQGECKNGVKYFPCTLSDLALLGSFFHNYSSTGQVIQQRTFRQCVSCEKKSKGVKGISLPEA